MQREQWSSGNLCFDNMLGGGFITGNKYEIYGNYATGKTTICATECCRIFLPYNPRVVTDTNGKEVIDQNTGKPIVVNLGGLVKEGEPIPKVFWIDMDGAFDKINPIYMEEFDREKKVKIGKSLFHEIAGGLGLDFDKDVKPNIIIFKNKRTIKEMIEELENVLLDASEYNIRLIIVDSITRLFQSESRDVKTNQPINNSQLFLLLNQLADSTPKGAAIICTNQSDIESYYCDPLLFNIKFNFNDRIHVFKQKRVFFAELIDSSSNPSYMGKFMITSHGIENLEN